MGVDVRTGGLVNLYEAGIVDSFDSVDRSLQNAVSIAANYLRVYTLIKAD
jgi:chaperonin GroEL (HSP60 family)